MYFGLEISPSERGKCLEAWFGFFFFGYFKTCAKDARSVYSFFLLAPVDGFNQRVGSAWARWVVVVITTKKSMLSIDPSVLSRATKTH